MNISIVKRSFESFVNLIYPHLCDACLNEVIAEGSSLCLKCISSMPATGFENHAGNPIEKKFYGRLPLVNATAQFYFSKASMMQYLLHLLKYRNQPRLGCQLGRFMGESLKKSARFSVDAIVPVPLYKNRERKRGYNQSMLLSEGISEFLNVPILNSAISRPLHTESQTKKGRVERWKNIEGKFVLNDPGLIRGKHILLVDDVITTGATLEACGAELLKVENSSLSIASLCYAYS